MEALVALVDARAQRPPAGVHAAPLATTASCESVRNVYEHLVDRVAARARAPSEECTRAQVAGFDTVRTATVTAKAATGRQHLCDVLEVRTLAHAPGLTLSTEQAGGHAEACAKRAAARLPTHDTSLLYASLVHRVQAATDEATDCVFDAHVHLHAHTLWPGREVAAYTAPSTDSGACTSARAFAHTSPVLRVTGLTPEESVELASIMREVDDLLQHLTPSAG
ncbi:hypothetical protein EON66_01180 [archaeon]|nr:MAG: hypothetical protein EON66_01180 [archaeon]